ncbi:MAG: hypothetical protein ABIR54_06005 [Burkholderiaceae bacterium]
MYPSGEHAGHDLAPVVADSKAVHRPHHAASAPAKARAAAPGPSTCSASKPSASTAGSVKQEGETATAGSGNDWESF